MFKILLLTTSLLFAEISMVKVPCDELKNIEHLIKDFSTGCYVNPNEYFLEQQFKGYDGNVTIDYEDREDVNTTIDKDGFINVAIVPDMSFYLVAGNYKSEKLKLYINASGTTSWRSFYTGTNRWRTYNFAPIEKSIAPPPPEEICNNDLIIAPELNIANFKKGDDYIFEAEAPNPKTTLSSVEIQVKTKIGHKYSVLLETNKEVKLWFSDGSHKPELITKTNCLALLSSPFLATKEVTKIWVQPQYAGIFRVAKLKIEEQIDDNLILLSAFSPQTVHGEKQYPAYSLLPNRIIWGEDNEDHKVNDPFIGKVRIKAIDWEYIDMTDDNGEFTFDITDRGEFILSAWDGSQWNSYSNTFSINIHDTLFEKRGDEWFEINSLNDIKLK